MFFAWGGGGGGGGGGYLLPSQGRGGALDFFFGELFLLISILLSVKAWLLVLF